MPSRLDIACRKALITKYFTKGWGPSDNILSLFKFRKLLSNQESCNKLVSKNYPLHLCSAKTKSNYRVIEGKFKTPLSAYLPGLFPVELEDAHFQVILPLDWKSNKYKPMCIHLAGTGDHFFWMRRNFMAKPLLEAGIGAIILENPFYGFRKPKDQMKSNLHHVSDIFIMGGCLILECVVLLNWCENLGFGPLGITGLSMGGHMASLAASNWPKPLVLVPCLSWSTASSVFTEGIMSYSIDWNLLQEQYLSNIFYSKTLSKLCKIVDNPFACQLITYSIGLLDSKTIEQYKSNVTPFELLNLLKTNEALNVSDSCHKSKDYMKNYMVPGKIDKRKHKMEALWFMRGLMDEFTHLKNFAVPVDTSLIIAVCAKADAYVPRVGVSKLQDVWPGVTVKYIDAGHVTAYIFHRKCFRDTIIEAFERAKLKLPPPKSAVVNNLI